MFMDNNGNNLLKLYCKSNLEKITISRFKQIKDNNQAIKYTLGMNDIQKNSFLKNVDYLHTSSLEHLHSEKIFIWKNESGSIYYELNNYGNKIKYNDEHILKLFSMQIKIYEKIEDVIIDNIPILVKNLIPIIRDAFYPLSNNEFFLINNIKYRNLFKPSTYFKYQNRKRIEQFEIGLMRSSIIETFIKYLVEDNDSFEILRKVIMNFNESKIKSNYAFVLIGDENSTNILIDEIIKPLFTSKNEHFATIDDELLEKRSDAKIMDNKIFYHVKNLSDANLNSKRVSKLILNIVRQNKITQEEAILNNETYIWGELFITSCKNNPYPILEDIYSKSIVIKVRNLKTILKKMNMDKISLIDNIEMNLSAFSNFLSNYSLFNIYNNVNRLQQTDEYKDLVSMTNGIIFTPALIEKINQFVIAVKCKDISFFNQISVENKELYSELLHNFNENMIAQPLISEYFNIINEDIIFEENNYLLDYIKQNYDMSEKTPDDKSKYHGKKRYKIKLYNDW